MSRLFSTEYETFHRPVPRAWRAAAVSFSIIAGVVVAAAGDGPLLDLQAVAEPLPWFDRERNYAAYDREVRDLSPNITVAVTSLGRPPLDVPIKLRLSRFRYPAEDRHLDALIRFDLDLDARPTGALNLVLLDADKNRLGETTIDSIPGSQLHLSFRWPADWSGQSGLLRATWLRNEGDAVVSEAPFEVAPAANVARSGRVQLTVPNKSGASVIRAPVTVGVPFPRGALDSIEHLRLVDENGESVPLQVKETARWSRFGSVKWVLCDFTLDLDGTERTVYLEYGPDVRREARAAMSVGAGPGFPTIDAGRIRLDSDGVWFDAAGSGAHRQVLEADALAGAFVEHMQGTQALLMRSTRGTVYAIPQAQQYEIEETGPEKVVLRAEGWFTEAETGDRFCQFVNRYVVHRDSPVIRIFHTWIFTGDGNRDIIRNMGWRFPLSGLSPRGFLTSFEEGGEWEPGYYLRQHDHDAFTIFDHSSASGSHPRIPDHWELTPWKPLVERVTGTRAPGVMAAQGDDVRLYVGVQDFWQNFPSSLMMEEDALTFYQWPRYGRMPQHPVSPDRISDVWKLWFAHEGNALSFRLPREITEGPIYFAETGREPHFAYGQPESVNAQGIAKTAEMWLYLTDSATEPASAESFLRGLREETVRAVVDPHWVAASGAFYEMGAAQPDQYPEFEAVHAESMRNPMRQVERMGVYGKWIYGDLLRTGNLSTLDAGLYRTFRKAHWGWPYAWTSFARSGDTDYLRFAQAATRMMSDTAFCHYVSEDVERFFAEELAPHQMWALLQPFRRIGWHNRNLLPWAGYWGPSTRCYVDQADYLWDAWFLTGYHRAKDVALTWAEQTKIEEADKIMRGPITAAQNRARWPANLQKQYLEMYENTWDPWFLAAAQGIADMHVWRWREEDWPGHFWHAGYVTWQRYSGCPQHEEFMRENVRYWTEPHQHGWASAPSTVLPAAVYGYLSTGDLFYLRRAAGVADLASWSVYRAPEPEHYHGFYVGRGTQADLLFTSWQQLWAPWIAGLYDRAGGEPEHPIPPAFDQAFSPNDRVALRKEEGQALPLRIGGTYVLRGPDGAKLDTGSGQPADTGAGSTGWHPAADDGDGEGGDSRTNGLVWIPAEAPAGVYTVELPGRRRSTRLPLSRSDTPEVFIPGANTVGEGQFFAQHWFMVPAEETSFWVEFDNTTPEQHVRQVVIWDPDGREVWAHREPASEHDPERPVVRAEISVPPGQAGRLWRLTLPGLRSMPFRLSPNLPPVLSHDRIRWFDPGAEETE